MSDRDELAKAIMNAAPVDETDGGWNVDHEFTADALWAAGYRKAPSREALVNAMIASDALAPDTRAEAMISGSTQREPFLMFADAILALLDGDYAETSLVGNSAHKENGEQ